MPKTPDQFSEEFIYQVDNDIASGIAVSLTVNPADKEPVRSLIESNMSLPDNQDVQLSLVPNFPSDHELVISAGTGSFGNETRRQRMAYVLWKPAGKAALSRLSIYKINQQIQNGVVVTI